MFFVEQDTVGKKVCVPQHAKRCLGTIVLYYQFFFVIANVPERQRNMESISCECCFRLRLNRRNPTGKGRDTYSHGVHFERRENGQSVRNVVFCDYVSGCAYEES